MEPVDIREKGGVRGGVQQTSDRRMFFQLLVFTGAESTASLVSAVQHAPFESVLYEDANDPRGVGLLTWSDKPDFFVGELRTFLNHKFSDLVLRPEFTMLGRTYSLGHEPNLEDWLLDRPRRTVTMPEWRWHVWYPLRRKGEFNALPQEEQTAILREHGRIGHAFGEAELATDMRLACFGMDQHDNDFVIGLIGRELYPLSACVQAMRKTKQTSTFMEKMGPFFVGRAIWQSTVTARGE
ncbi:MAG TPA: chlorite dismutase family protein [Bryobacteraceae bacterium]|nr:chlorite dismutase family protein [Bryobacteraceae bacterium]